MNHLWWCKFRQTETSTDDVARMSTPDTLIPSLVFKGKEMHHQK
jgi:hypothetical protein